MSCPPPDGSLAALFTIIAPMVPTENSALPEIRDVAWHLLRPDHVDYVSGRLQQSLITGFIIALALKGLVTPDCLKLPVLVASGVRVRLSAPSTSARLGARVESLESQLVLVLAAAASAEVPSAARSDALDAPPSHPPRSLR